MANLAVRRDQATACQASDMGSGGEDPSAMCADPCIVSMLSCKDDPSMAAVLDPGTLSTIEALCSSGGSDCMSKANLMTTIFAYGGVCCDDPGGCDTEAPTKCSAACAAQFTPFWSSCGSWLQNLAQSQGSEDFAVMEDFAAKCSSGH